MRVMLGKDTEPSLLVDVESGNYPTEFKFWVVNGAWYGSFINGMVIVDHYLHHQVDNMLILCDNQDRLRGEYQDVFENFDNPNYVAPKPEYKPLSADWYDDIPF